MEDLTRKAMIVLDKCEANGLYVKPEKCEFFTTKVSLLGFIVEDGNWPWKNRKSPPKIHQRLRQPLQTA